jgi:hypothetical protein
MRRIILVFTVAALMAVMAASSAAAQGPPEQAQGPPVGGCPESYDPGLVPVEVVLAGAGLEEPDPSMDPNGDGFTCLKLIDTGQGTRATWHDNVIKHEPGPSS